MMMGCKGFDANRAAMNAAWKTGGTIGSSVRVALNMEQPFSTTREMSQKYGAMTAVKDGRILDPNVSHITEDTLAVKQSNPPGLSELPWAAKRSDNAHSEYKQFDPAR
jgi:hypothetical protein